MLEQVPFSPWAEEAADLLAQALAVGLAEEGAPLGDTGYESVLGLNSELDAELAGQWSLHSNLPPDWGAAQQLQAVQAAWHDLLHTEEQLATVYNGFTDQQWVEAIESHLLSGEAFQACSLQQHADIWSAYAQLAGIASLPLVSKVLAWVHEGYPLQFVDPLDEQQQLHPKFDLRLQRARLALAGVVPAHLLESYLQAGEPQPVVFQNHRSCVEHAEFVKSELESFVALGALQEVDASKGQGLVVHPMSVAEHPVTGKLRLCVDANYVNIFEPYQPVQFELLSDVFPLVQAGDFSFVTDCTKGYLHVPLHPSAQRFLCVGFGGVTYMFKALPFGLSSAVKACTDLMAVAYLPLRREGVRFSFMIDDRVGLAATRAACWLHILITVRIVCALGFHLGLNKCVLWPCQRLKYLGMLLALDSMQCMVPEQKLQRFVQAVEQAVSAEVVTPRLLARVAGMLVSFGAAVPLGRLYTRQLFWALSGKSSWDEVMPVGPELRQHLSWLASYVSAHNG